MQRIVAMILVIITLIGLWCAVKAGMGCSFPASAANFQYNGLKSAKSKLWEVLFEEDCVCTELNVSIQDYTTVDGLADNDCK
ncbi:hypothetical protein EON65_21980 [archaeon]|nr:MAG: hypothetical protein EON65_21980 [archaeon]